MWSSLDVYCKCNFYFIYFNGLKMTTEWSKHVVVLYLANT